MSVAGVEQHPYVTVTKATVGARALPVQLVGPAANARPVGVSRTPKVTFPQPVALGDSGARRNYDIDEFELSSWTEGMGEDTYPGHTPPASFAYGTLETRYPGVLTLRPQAVQLGAKFPLHPDHHASILELGATEARLVVAGYASAGQRLTAAGAWTPLLLGGTAQSLTQGLLAAPGMHVATGFTLYRSSDGVTWTQSAQGAMLHPTYLAQFDNRLWCLDVNPAAAPGAQVLQLYQSTDIGSLANPAAATWAAGAVLTLPAREFAVRLFVWVDPSDNDRPALWLLTERRLFFLDYYSQAPSWQEWFVARRADTNGTVKGWATVHPKNNGLYASFGGYDSRWVWEFIGPGRTVARYSPNAKGGYPFPVVIPAPGPPLPGLVPQSPWGLWADNLGLYVFGGADETLGGTNEGLLVMADPGAFHSVWGASWRVLAGGIGDRALWVAGLYNQADTSSTVWEISLDGQERLPQHALGRRYERPSGATLCSAWVHCGYKNVWKNLRYVEVDCVRQDGTPGLETGRLTVLVRSRAGGLTNLGSLTSASSFPAVLTVPGGVNFKEAQVVLAVDATVGPAVNAPYVRAVKLGYRPRPKQRYTYAVRLDLRDDAPAFRAADGQFRGQTAASLRLFVDELSDNDDPGGPDPLVGLSYGGRGSSLAPLYRSIPDCEVLVTAQESPDGGDGLYLLQFNDVSAPGSG